VSGKIRKTIVMKEGLEKIIKRIILPKYPFIKDFDIKVSTFSPTIGGVTKIAYQRFTVVYYVSPNEDGSFTVDDSFAKIEELTENLFKMIGPKNYQYLGGIEFYSNED
jgi:hypothetical protein